MSLIDIEKINKTFLILSYIKHQDESGASKLINQDPELLSLGVEELTGTTPLICAVEQKKFIPSLDFFKLLVDSTANLNAQCNNGFSTLHWIATYNRVELFSILVNNKGERTIDYDLQNNEGNTPIHLASFENAPEMLLELLKGKANPNIINNKGQAPLHFACLQGNVTCVRLLLSAGAKVNATDSNNLSAIHYLAQSNADNASIQATLSYLETYGIDMSKRSRNNQTAYQMAEHFHPNNEPLIDAFHRRRIPSLLNLCKKSVALNLKQDTAVRSIGLPKTLSQEIIKIRNCH